MSYCKVLNWRMPHSDFDFKNHLVQGKKQVQKINIKAIVTVAVQVPVESILSLLFWKGEWKELDTVDVGDEEDVME